MTQNQVHRAVAKATGESVGTIRQMGFSVADPGHVRFDSEPPDIQDIEERIIDWDWHDRCRNVPIVPQRSRRQTGIETKRVLLDEALDLDDLNDRMASVLDDLDA